MASSSFQNFKPGECKAKTLTIVAKIPYARVVTFGQIALLIGTIPKVVGNIMSGMNEDEMQKYPWQRVVSKNGFISSLKLGYKGMLQIELLQAENVEVDILQNKVNMSKYQLSTQELEQLL